jgi:nucleoid DNA-binding protein
MKHSVLVKRIAAHAGITPAAAADGLDALVTRILSQLRKGSPVSLGELGVFEPGESPQFRFRETSRKKGR